MTLVLSAFLLFAVSGLLGCGTAGGGGNAAPTAESAIAVDPIHLAPGQASAQLAWPSSEGPIANYLVFESRNDSAYAFTQIVVEPTASVSGQPGDSVRVTVIGVSPTGEVSEASPPSPPLVFHPAASAAVAEAAPSGSTAIRTANPAAETATSSEPSDTQSLATESSRDAESGNRPNSDAPDALESETEEATSLLARAMRALLLNADARLPERGLSSEASRWLQIRVDHEIAAGVSLAGTGRADAEDALRELVWQDQAGQLFVSDGQRLLDSDDLPSTFDVAVRLRTTERFVGLADFNGDGHGDWLIEDTSTGAVWVVDGETDLNLSTDQIAAETRLAGHGDFDGDGQAELLWLDANNRFQLTRPGGETPTESFLTTSPDGFELLAIADLDGNGRDDLLGRGADGRLVIARAVESSPANAAGPTIEWRTGPANQTDGLDLLATLDVDEDGTGEIAWLNGDSLEIWNAESGLQMTFGL